MVDEALEQATLERWRRGAADVFMIVSAVVYLPAILLVVVGQGPRLAWPMVTVATVGYLGVVAIAVLRRRDYRVRVVGVLTIGYLLATVGAVAAPHAPFPRILPVALPMIALVFIGARAGRLATLISTLVVLAAPFLRAVPGLAAALCQGPPETLEPAGLLLTQGVTLAAVLFGLVFMLERFLQFLNATLAAQRRATADMERRAMERDAALQDLAHEMDERSRLEREVARIGDEERRRLGQDVHDGVCQQITGALLCCQALERRLARGVPLSVDDLGALSSLLEEAIDEARGVAKGLCPLDPDPEALLRALRVVARRTQASAGIPCEFTAAGESRVHDPIVAQHLYRLAQEAVSNAARHAQAGRIVVSLSGDDHHLQVQVEDDGIGLPPDATGRGIGLRTMACRAQMLRGEFRAEARPGAGTRITCRVPRPDLPEPAKPPAGAVETETHGS